MRSNKIVSALRGAAIALVTSTGCGGDSAEQTDLAKLPPPSQAVIDAAKTQPSPKGRPKFGAPPRSELLKAMRKP
jgi:hypothetical protein